VKVLAVPSRIALAAAGALTFGAAIQSDAEAKTLVATIYGVYDAAACGDSASCLAPPPTGSLAPGYATNGGTSSDTPSLFFNNDTAFDFTDVKVVLTAYQGLNQGSSTTVPSVDLNLGTIAANTLFQLRWSETGGGFGNPVPSSPPTTSANLFSFDYDDYYQTFVSQPGCILGSQYCATPGNFDVTFTAMWNGQPIFSQFSPDNTQGPGNAAGAFVGWEGLDPTGLSETVYDNHSGAVSGVLANIFVGTPGVPEPSTWAMLLVGFAGLGYAGYRRGAKARPAIA
jgi:hypothetical protein